MTTSSLRNQSCKELAQLARAMGLAGWHSMRKDELIRALVNQARRKPKRPTNGEPVILAATAMLSRVGSHSNGKGSKSSAHERFAQLANRLAEVRQISSTKGKEPRRQSQDRLVVMVRDPYWLH